MDAPTPIDVLLQRFKDTYTMYERFTDRARKSLALANQEAQRFNHEYIGTEHILLGIAKEGGGVAANVLKNLDVDLRKVRLEVEKLVKTGPDMVTIGRLPQTPRAKLVIEYAIKEARELNHNYVGTEHLLLGLLREHDGVAAQVLMNLGLKLEEVREEVLNLLGAGVGVTPAEQDPPEVVREVAAILARKDEAIRDGNYELAASLVDKASELSTRVKESWQVKAKKAITALELANMKPAINYAHIQAKIDIAEASVRELLAATAPTSDLSVIRHLSDLVSQLVDLRKYYADLQSASTDCT
jgi:ATP-dependent Clp protease ATP-binding subunit ClpA